ncbi:MAG: ABC transporter permease [Chloroflexi bacterium]|nr:ABC transporter permease [Chloroflexota bacterium]
MSKPDVQTQDRTTRRRGRSIRRSSFQRALAALVTLILVNALAWMLTDFLRLRRFEPGRPWELSAALRGYVAYVTAIPHGRLGQMPGTGQEAIATVLAAALPKSLLLLGLAVAASAIGGIFLGYLAVDRRRGQARDGLLVASIIGFSMPAFYVGLLGLQSGYWLRKVTGSGFWVLPSGGFGLDRHLILPVIALSVRPMTEIARLTSILMEDQLGEDYVRTAKAKGLSWRRVAMRHVLRRVLGTIVTAIGNTTQYLVSSLIVVEVFFRWPGVGLLLARAIAPRTDGRESFNVLFEPDLVAGLVSGLALLAISINLSSDLIARRLDPNLGRERS